MLLFLYIYILFNQIQLAHGQFTNNLSKNLNHVLAINFGHSHLTGRAHFIWLVIIKRPFLLLNNLNDINCGPFRKCVMSPLSFGQYTYKIWLEII